MESTEEKKIMDNLIEVNLDACRFYHEAAYKASIPKAEEAFYDLERVHTGIVEELSIAAFRKSSPEMRLSGSMPQASSVFGRLRKSRFMHIDALFLIAVENAEYKCMRILQQAVRSDDVSMDIKMHVLGAVAKLKRAHEYIHRLKNLPALYGSPA